MIVVNVLQPGTGLTIDPASLDMKTVSTYTAASKGLTTIDFLLNVIPATVFDAFTKGEILQVLLFSVLFGLAALSLGKSVAPLIALLDQTGKTLFAIVGIIMRLAPIGAFGAMAFTVGRYGVHSLISLGQLMAGMYVTCLLFVFVVLGAIARAVGFGILPFLKYQRGDPDRARDLLVRIPRCRRSWRSSNGSAVPSRSWGSWCRPAIPSTSTAPPST
jgi:aerobic C4-dicarboxylate transport protein